jgi:hypothetical protein
MRDFRDSKTMAHSLRKALATQEITVTNSLSLELVARAFGLTDWNTLSAKIEAATAPAPQPAADAALCCSFCGKSQHAVETLIAGPEVHICSECVGLCDGILIDGRLKNTIAEVRGRDPQADPAATAAEALKGYSDEQLESVRRGAAGWLEHIAWSLEQIASRLGQGGEVRRWQPDEGAQRRGWIRDPLAGKTGEQVAALRAELQARHRDVRERMRLVDEALAARGLA